MDVRRVRHAFLILLGREPYRFSTERMEFEMAFENTTAAIEELKAASQRLIAQLHANEQSAAAANSALGDVATADEATAAAVQSVTDSLNAASPPTPPTA